ncbi:hypothetical protein [Caloramator australicus]|uniref:hypothetical protein n=1 Tax=Caloramator australicus TaxID=515264 RepID=UPI00058E15D9|nr:hypothetical protein [Caloramator australicus]
MKVLRDRNGLIDEFCGNIWNMVIKTVKAYEDGKMVFVFKDVMRTDPPNFGQYLKFSWLILEIRNFTSTYSVRP